MKRKRIYLYDWKGLGLIVAVAAAFLICVGAADAFTIKTNNENLKLQWDNTFKYNLGIRAKSADADLLGTYNFDDGDRNFRSGGITTNRVDILSEFNFIYKEDYGFRISAAGWYDQRYRDPMDNTSVLTSNTLEGGTAGSAQTLGLSDRVKNYYKGPYGEILDAFVFGKFDLGSIPVNMKLGRFTMYWGESFLGFINAISYSQFPVDFAKALGVPGSEVKELFMPRGAFAFQAQLTTTLGFQFQQFLEFNPARIPESGSYLGGVDLYQKGADLYVLAPGFGFKHDSDIEPDGFHDYGFALNWNPDFLTPVTGKLGFFFRNFTDQLPQVYVDGLNGQFFFVYPDNIKLYGASASFALAGFAVGLEYNYRTNMPLNSTGAVVLGTRPGKGDTEQARGDVHLATLNFFKIFGPTAISDSATGILEFTYCHLQRVSQGEATFKGPGNPTEYTAIDRVTRDALGVAISYTPTWFAVWPEWDLSLPLSYSIGLFGSSAVNSGDAEGNGSGKVGVSLDYKQKYTFSLAYNFYYGDHDFNPATGTMAIRGGLPATLYDRDWVSFTFKTNF